MKKSLIAPLITLGALLMTACSGGVRTSAPIAVYDFGLPASASASHAVWSKIAVEVKSPPWFESLPIDYRLAYDEPLKLREYSESRWAGAPADLLAQRLRQQLGLAAANGNTAVDCLLRIDLQEFSQVFDSEQTSRGVLRAQASLIGKRQVLAERPFGSEHAVATPNAQGGARALVAAATDLGRQLDVWLKDLEQDKSLARCGMSR